MWQIFRVILVYFRPGFNMSWINHINKAFVDIGNSMNINSGIHQGLMHPIKKNRLEPIKINYVITSPRCPGHRGQRPEFRVRIVAAAWALQLRIRQSLGQRWAVAVGLSQVHLWFYSLLPKIFFFIKWRCYTVQKNCNHLMKIKIKKKIIIIITLFVIN